MRYLGWTCTFRPKSGKATGARSANSAASASAAAPARRGRGDFGPVSAIPGAATRCCRWVRASALPGSRWGCRSRSCGVGPLGVWKFGTLFCMLLSFSPSPSVALFGGCRWMFRQSGPHGGRGVVARRCITSRDGYPPFSIVNQPPFNGNIVWMRLQGTNQTCIFEKWCICWISACGRGSLFTPSS